MSLLITPYFLMALSGLLVAIFTIEQMVNGWKHGFADPKNAPHHESLGSEVL